jgi:transcriptional regulator with XRE-family HTH domain
MDISKRLISLREKKDLTQEQLAKLSGLSRTIISQIENGSKKVTKNIIEKLSNGLNVSIEYLTSVEIDNPNDFRRKKTSLREFTYINIDRVINLLQSTGQLYTEKISTEIEKSIENSIGLDKVAVAKNQNNSKSTVKADLKKDDINYATDFIDFLEENTIPTSLPNKFEDVEFNEIYTLSADLKLSDFNKATENLSQIFSLVKEFAAFGQEIENLNMVEQFLAFMSSEYQYYLAESTTNYKVIVKTTPKYFRVPQEIFAGKSIIIFKVTETINLDDSYSLLSSQFAKVIELSKNSDNNSMDGFYDSLKQLEPLGIKMNKESMSINGPSLVVEPIIIYK